MYGRLKRKERKKTFQTNFVFFSQLCLLFLSFKTILKSPHPIPKCTKQDKSALSWSCLHPYQVLLKALGLVLSAAKHFALCCEGSINVSSPWGCSALVAAIVPKCCMQVYTAEPPLSLDWHKWRKRGKQREEGRLESAVKHLRCSTGQFEKSNTACTSRQDDMS